MLYVLHWNQESKTWIDMAQNINLYLSIIANIAVISGAIFAIIQYSKQKRLTKVTNAIDIAKHFANELVDKCSFFLTCVYADSDINNMLEKHREDIEHARYFNKTEVEKIFTNEEIEMYNKFICKNFEVNDRLKINLKGLLQDILNQLEHCSISFNSGIADDNAVYQSLHQTLFLLMPSAYPLIASINDNIIDQYYTNLCDLYVRWHNIKLKSIRKAERAKKRIEKYNSHYNKSGKIKTTKV